MREKNIRPESKFIVNVINTEKEGERIYEALKEKLGTGSAQTILETSYKYGWVTGEDNQTYLLCSEGVGSQIPLEMDEGEISWYSQTFHEGGKITMSLAPVAVSTYTLADVLSLPILKTVRLDEFIRVFGDRLEANFAVWQKFLTKGA